MSWFARHIAPSFREPITWGDLAVFAIVIEILRALK